MAAATLPASMPNGAHAHSAIPSASDVAEYAKLVRLRDAVFAGQHPKLKLLNPAANSTTTAAGNLQAVGSNNALDASLSRGNERVKQLDLSVSQQALPSAHSNGQLMPAGLSSIGVLQEKSPLLIATESNISRAELESAIRQEVKRRSIMWPKLDKENILPDFDVDTIFKKAQEAVKPVLIDQDRLGQKDRSPAGSPNDSYYSSNANDDEPDGVNTRAHDASKPCFQHFKGKCFRGKDCKFSHDPAFAAQLQPAAPLTENDRSYANAGNNGHPAKKQKRDNVRVPQHNGNIVNLVEDSPGRGRPRADDQYRYESRPQGGNFDITLDDGHNVPTPPSARRPPPQERRFSGRGMTPSRDVPVSVVRSTITSPMAPQPARISPLATKGPGYMERMHVDGPQGAMPRVNSTNQSPQNIQQPHVRKRRRDTNGNQGPGSANVRRRIASPEVRIKDEPVSPRPLDSTPRYVPREEVVRRVVDVDSYVREPRVEPRAVREMRYPDELGSHRASSPVVRVLSRAEPRLEPRREPELRRVISERQMIRPHSPTASIRGPAQYDEAHHRPMPPPSREVYVSRSDPDLRATGRASVAPQGSAYHEYDQEPRRVHQQGSMAPPPPLRRVVTDKWGNQFEERIITEPPRYSVVPEPRYVDTYGGRPVSRVGSVVPESIQYRDAPQRRPEQEPTSPRFAEYPPASARAASVAPGHQYSSGQPQVVRIGEYPMDDRYERVERVVREAPPGGYMERPREVYVEDGPRDGAYRVPSVRPEAARYVVEADDRYMRQASMRPPPSTYERVAQPMAPPPRYEYQEGRGERERTISRNGPHYID